MKKMLAKAVVLGLVLGGIGFVANDALAAEIGPAVKVETGLLKWDDVLGYEDGKKINAEAEAAAKAAGEAKTVATAAQTTANAAQAAAAKNADDIKTNSTAISAETEARIKADDELDEKIGENTKAINNEVTERKAEVARLDSKIDKLDARVEKVGAMAAAIANLHTMGYDPEAPTEIGFFVKFWGLKNFNTLRLAKILFTN